MEPIIEQNGHRSVLHVLVVEDNVDCAESTASLLRMYGHEVEVSKDGQSALAVVEDHPPDVVLLDLGLPGKLNGWDVARQLKRTTREKQPLIIAVTGFGTSDARRYSIEAGIDLHLTKPVDPQLLERLLSRFRGILCE